MMKTIYRNDALNRLEDRKQHSIKVWELATGEIIHYKNAVCIGGWKRKGLHRVFLPNSKEIRAFRDVCMFEIDDMKIYF